MDSRGPGKNFAQMAVCVTDNKRGREKNYFKRFNKFVGLFLIISIPIIKHAHAIYKNRCHLYMKMQNISSLMKCGENRRLPETYGLFLVFFLIC
jgi:hypothetical protein